MTCPRTSAPCCLSKKFLRLDTERHRESTALLCRGLELDESKWEAIRDPTGSLLAMDALFNAPPCLSTLIPTLEHALIPSTPQHPPPEVSDTPLSVSSAAIEPPLSGPLLCVPENFSS